MQENTHSPAPDVTRADVLIVGAGPVGTALALDLQLRGVDAIAIDRAVTIPDDHPRGGNVNMRTVEHYRRWGIEERLLGLATAVNPDGRQRLVPTGGRTVTFVESLLGKKWGAHPFNYGRTREEHWHLAAAPSVSVNQPKVHTLLRQRAEELGARILTGHDFQSLAQDAGGVDVVTATADGSRHRFRARYVVACDGAQSPAAKAVGLVRESNTDAVTWLYAVIVRLVGTTSSELFTRLQFTYAGYLVVANADIVSSASPVSEHLWRFTLRGQHGDTPPSDAAVLDVARSLFGGGVELAIESVSRYRRQVRIAQAYRRGNVFVAGDAAHLFPPTGGHNQNLGIEDVINLSWKLGAVLAGWADPALLDSYDSERRPIGWQTGLSSDRISGRWPVMQQLLSERSEHDDDEQARQAFSDRLYHETFAEWNTHGVVLDVRYPASAAIVDDGSSAPPWDETRYRPFAKPGHRAPHVRLADDSALFDHLGAGFTLLALEADAGQVDAFISAAAARSVPLKVLRPAPADQAALWLHYQAPLALIRPDQYVAWRGTISDAGAAGAIVDTVRGGTPATAAHAAAHAAWEANRAGVAALVSP